MIPKKDSLPITRLTVQLVVYLPGWEGKQKIESVAENIAKQCSEPLRPICKTLGAKMAVLTARINVHQSQLTREDLERIGINPEALEEDGEKPEDIPAGIIWDNRMEGKVF